jgi:hypothetical protein
VKPTKSRSKPDRNTRVASQEFPTPNPGVFDFTPEDLKANQQGFISERQRGYLHSTARGIRSFSWTSATVGLSFLLFGMCLVLASFLQNADSRDALFSSPSNLLLMAGGAVVVVALIALSVLLNRRQAASLTQASLGSAEGIVRLHEGYSPNSAITSYNVHVGGQKFSFSEDMGRIFQEGRKYRVYFCKSGVHQLILSLEQLPS